ncbi:Gfo/Idh/MocA family oxidoreductase [Mesobacillus jeotgali]|uniref:Gfo/Idh/MocA family oxidoreductase n=1 Tax=Mesobacillus jeotgali TaxID=129985 RepID=A0ABY9VIZ1_9BACI|nr:Gfo/Idh/MocA family oxidoreductase [Mesobacillus jeotgali]WNF23922.1 Gfo/Idh/MocA family oxidoreductase [Mesobacillus jeotgali]
MLKIGVIGLGDIAQKAYLPIFAEKGDIEFHLFTRDFARLKNLGAKYRFSHLHLSLDELIESGIKGAFVHSATESHYDIVKQLLLSGIHVYVDKPIAYEYEKARELTELAEEKGLILMTGFNRRYAPAYKQLAELKEPNMVIMQKNRKSLPGEIRHFILDDFIHVVDTLRFLFPYQIKRVNVTGKKNGAFLHHVVIQLQAEEGIAIGIMNRDSGVVEERVEVFQPNEKRTALNVSELLLQENKSETKLGGSDWEPTLHKRGFEQIVFDFIQAVSNDKEPLITAKDSLETQKICEGIVKELETL